MIRPTSLPFAAPPILLIALTVAIQPTARADDLPPDLAPHFSPPPELADDLGDYRSPLIFYDGRRVETASDWRERRREILERWHGILGRWPPLIENPRIEYLAEERRENLTQQRVRIEIAPGGRTVEGYLQVPDGDGPHPAVVVVYYDAETGAGLGKELRDFGYQLARRGFVALSIGTPGCRYYPDAENAELQPLSTLAYVAANCYNALASLPAVDPERVGIVGHSYGGKWAMFASCLYEKFACAAWSDGGIVFDEKRPNVNYWEPWYLGYEPGETGERGIPSEEKPRVGAYRRLVEGGHDLHDLHALMAPRPFLVSGGSEDRPERWRPLNHSIAVNELLGYKNRVAMTNRRGHTPTHESNQQIYRFFEHFLKSSPMAAAAKPDDAKRPNILWIVGENLKLDLGCYGAKNVRTPHLDALARDGVRYTRVFSTSPVCAPSRSAFLTGMYQTSTDTHHMRSHRDDEFRLPPGVRPLTHRLRDAGYFTANIETIGDRVVGTGKLDLNFVNEGLIYESDEWSKLKSNQPFFAQINTPEVEYDIYDRKTASKERVEWVGEREHPRIATPENVTPPPYYPDHSITREEWARYLNSVSGLDRRVGWILEQLRSDGLADDTVVVFFADNGRLEARGIHWCYDTGLHVPMIIRWPAKFPAPPQYRPGTADDRVISLLDLTATMLAIAGLPRPAGMQSRIFLGDDADPPRKYAFSARDRIDETVNRIRSVRDARYRYNRNFLPEQSFAALNRYKEKCFAVKPLMRELLEEGKLSGPAAKLFDPLPREQLFDTESDPHEIHNLVDSPKREHREALLRLRAALDTWIVETGDLGQRPEPPEVIAPFEEEMHEWFGTPEWYERRGGGED